MDVFAIIELTFKILGGAVILLGLIAPLTKSEKDDKFLLALKKALNGVKLNKSDKTVLIQVK